MSSNIEIVNGSYNGFTMKYRGIKTLTKRKIRDAVMPGQPIPRIEPPQEPVKRRGRPPGSKNKTSNQPSMMAGSTQEPAKRKRRTKEEMEAARAAEAAAKMTEAPKTAEPVKAAQKNVADNKGEPAKPLSKETEPQGKRKGVESLPRPETDDIPDDERVLPIGKRRMYGFAFDERCVIVKEKRSKQDGGVKWVEAPGPFQKDLSRAFEKVYSLIMVNKMRGMKDAEEIVERYREIHKETMKELKDFTKQYEGKRSL